MTWTVPDQGEAANDLQSELFQSSLDALAAGLVRTGVVSGCAVTAQASPDMTVAVAAGVVSLANATASVTAGNVTIGTADATNPRLDLVVANGSGVKSVIAGTAAASPKEATLDTTTYVLLAQVYVPAAATTITTARITDRRVILSSPSVTWGYRSGDTIEPVYQTGTTSNDGGTMFGYYVPLRVGSTVSVNAIRVEVTTGGSAGAVLRVGLYTDNNGRPGTLLVDAGTVDATTAATKSASFTALSLLPGMYWVMVQPQVAQSTTRRISGSVFPRTMLSVNFANSWNGFYVNNGTYTGALPSSSPTITGDATGVIAAGLTVV